MEVLGALQARRVVDVRPGEVFVGNYGGANGVLAMIVRRVPAERPSRCVVLSPPSKGVPSLVELQDAVLAVLPDVFIGPEGHPTKTSGGQRATAGGLFLTPRAAYVGAQHGASTVWVDIATGLLVEHAGEEQPGLLFMAWDLGVPKLPPTEWLYKFDLSSQRQKDAANAGLEP